MLNVYFLHLWFIEFRILFTLVPLLEVKVILYWKPTLLSFRQCPNVNLLPFYLWQIPPLKSANSLVEYVVNSFLQLWVLLYVLWMGFIFQGFSVFYRSLLSFLPLLLVFFAFLIRNFCRFLIFTFFAKNLYPFCILNRLILILRRVAFFLVRYKKNYILPWVKKGYFIPLG